MGKIENSKMIKFACQNANPNNTNVFAKFESVRSFWNNFNPHNAQPLLFTKTFLKILFIFYFLSILASREMRKRKNDKTVIESFKRRKS